MFQKDLARGFRKAPREVEEQDAMFTLSSFFSNQIYNLFHCQYKIRNTLLRYLSHFPLVIIPRQN